MRAGFKFLIVEETQSWIYFTETRENPDNLISSQPDDCLRESLLNYLGVVIDSSCTEYLSCFASLDLDILVLYFRRRYYAEALVCSLMNRPVEGGASANESTYRAK